MPPFFCPLQAKDSLCSSLRRAYETETIDA